MTNVYICDYLRTPIGRYGGALSSVRTDDLAAEPIKALMARHTTLDWSALDDVILGCTNQAGEDNRNVARMALLLAGLPQEVPGITVNRLCASSMDAILMAARQIRAGEGNLFICGGVESMSRAPLVMPKAETPFSRNAEIYETSLGWRFINPKMQEQYGTDSMGETAENVAQEFNIQRQDQDAFALRSQQRAASASASGRLAKEICPVFIHQRKGNPLIVEHDEHPRPETTLEALEKLRTPFRAGGSVTAGNASGINDGSAALIVASEEAVKQHGLTPLVKILGGASAGLAPRIMGYGPAPATSKLCERLNLNINDIDLLEFNEAFACQVLASIRALGLPDDADFINPNGGAIAFGHPLGASGARITGTLALQMSESGASKGIAAMCVGVGQGVAIGLEAV
ncbi:MAG: 3-oxoadipyl-CoA thiolase [Gammaproteobacteria bacterium]|jgi:acetyl-CoA acyltransferase|nr:3-oxoadipyl-CoA thiolase [Gammaproteobacteria bacterium]